MAAPTNMTAAQRALRSRMGAYARHAQGKTTNAAAVKGACARFEREVDPDGVLPPEVRYERAKAAEKAWMTGIALKSSQARAKKRSGTKDS